MSRQTSCPPSTAKRKPPQRRSPAQRTRSRQDRSAQDVLGEVDRLVAAMGSARHFVSQLADFDGTTLLLSASDTGRELAIELGEDGVDAYPYEGGPFDVRIRATEWVHQAILYGELDADAAFFAGRVRVSGSLITAFRVKNRFLSLLQRHLAGEAGAMAGDSP